MRGRLERKKEKKERRVFPDHQSSASQKQFYGMVSNTHTLPLQRIGGSILPVLVKVLKAKYVKYGHAAP